LNLLAKNAEDRYQTAASVEADLRRCLTQLESGGRIDPFPLGAYRASDRLLIPEKLYGREGEIAILLAAFERVVTRGHVELVLVSGYSGIGKSSFVNELQKVLVPPRALFLRWQIRPVQARYPLRDGGSGLSSSGSRHTHQERGRAGALAAAIA